MRVLIVVMSVNKKIETLSPRKKQSMVRVSYTFIYSTINLYTLTVFKFAQQELVENVYGRTGFKSEFFELQAGWTKIIL